MGSDWVELTVSEIADVIGGSTPSTKDPSNFDGDIPWLTPKDLSTPHPRYVSRGERNLTEKGLSSCSAQLLPINSVLLSSRAPIGYLAIAKNPIATNQGFRSLILKPGFDHEFVYYLLSANVEKLEQYASGSTFKELSGSSLKKIRLKLPSELKEQRAIAHILSSLDDKIELNFRMRENLEGIARAIFKSWFVDFEPVRAKVEGRNTGLPVHIADLFPNRLVDSELDEIPEGWECENLGELIELAYGKGLKADNRLPGEIPVYGANGQIGWHNESLVNGPGIVVGRKGVPGTVSWVESSFYPIDTTFYVIPISKLQSVRFLYFALQFQNLAFLASDSAVPGLNRNFAYMNLQCVPPGELVSYFDRFAETLLTRADVASKESRTLSDLRDTLLTKLISGELRIQDPDRFLTWGIS